MTAREIFLELLKPDGRPERQLVQYEALQMCLGDPISRYLHQGRMPGARITDLWGTVIDWPADAPGSMPIVTEETRVLHDITRWQDEVHAPDIRSNCSDPEAWAKFREKSLARAGDERIVTGFMGTGIFEQCHFLMPFEEVLTNMYDHPKEMHELIEYITDYRLRYVKMLIEGLRPEALFSHDDWGTKTALFMKPDMWREFFKEPYRKFYGYIRSEGVIAIHHADSYLAPIVHDMAEIGIQVWQGTLPENNIPKLQEELQGKLVLMGGIGAAIDREDAEEEEVRTYVRSALRAYCPGGHFIPSITYGLSGTVYKHVDPWIDDEIRKYNEGIHLPRFRASLPSRVNPIRIRPAAPSSAGSSGIQANASPSAEPHPAAGSSYAPSTAGNAPAAPSEAERLGRRILSLLAERSEDRSLSLAEAIGAAALDAMKDLPGGRPSQATAAAAPASRKNGEAPVQSAADRETGAPDELPGDGVRPSEGLSLEQASLLSDISDALQDGSVRQTLQHTEEALAAGIDPETILTRGLVRGMNELGEDFTLGEVFVPEMLRAAKCMSAATDRLKPLLAANSGGGKSGRVCLGTVRGDLHDIGKNLVKIMMEGSGLEVIDLGVDVTAEDFIAAAREQDCDIIACSSLLTTSMGEMARVVELAGEAGIRDKVQILIGGAPVSQEYCEQIGADAYSEDAASAARMAVQMLR